jgi:hypothetical protein
VDDQSLRTTDDHHGPAFIDLLLADARVRDALRAERRGGLDCEGCEVCVGEIDATETQQ